MLSQGTGVIGQLLLKEGDPVQSLGSRSRASCSKIEGLSSMVQHNVFVFFLENSA